MIWVVTAVWLAGVVFAAWRYFRVSSKARLAVYVVVGLVGLLPYLWFLFLDQLPAGYRSVMSTFWVLLAAASAATVRRRQESRQP